MSIFSVWRSLKTWGDQANSLWLLAGIVASLFVGGMVANAMIGEYAKTADLAPGQQATATKLENHETRIITLEVGVAKDIEWIRRTLREMARRDGWVPPPEPK